MEINTIKVNTQTDKAKQLLNLGLRNHAPVNKMPFVMLLSISFYTFAPL